MKKYLPYIIFGSALFISIVAEYFSIFGISKLFSGAKTETIFLAIGLGVAKLVTVTSIQTYWKVLSNVKFLRIYLVVAAVILMIVTSAGTYGFLAAAYQETANQDRLVQTRIELLKTKHIRFKEQHIQLSGESKSLATSLENLRKSLATDNQYQTVDKRTGAVLTQVQSTSKKGVQDQIDKTSGKKDEIDLKLDRLSDSISFYDLAIIETEANSKSSSELGPLKYLSGLTGYPMDKIINWLMILLVFVIDPLAIALVLTAQFAFKANRWIQGAETRRKNKSAGKSVKSPTIDDIDVDSINPPESPDRLTETKSEPSTGIVTPVSNLKRRGRPKGSNGQYKKTKDDVHFNVDIDPIADPDGILKTNHVDRTTIETGLTENVIDQLAKSLEKKS